jgi:hypothetical protein
MMAGHSLRDAALVLLVAGCTGSDEPAVARAYFGTTPDGEAVQVFTLTNGNGIEF